MFSMPLIFEILMALIHLIKTKMNTSESQQVQFLYEKIPLMIIIIIIIMYDRERATTEVYLH